MESDVDRLSLALCDAEVDALALPDSLVTSLRLSLPLSLALTLLESRSEALSDVDCDALVLADTVSECRCDTLVLTLSDASLSDAR